jgi:hypothetical protein
LCHCACARPLLFFLKIRLFGILTLDDFAMQRKGLLLVSRFAIKIIYKLAWYAQAGYFFAPFAKLNPPD